MSRFTDFLFIVIQKVPCTVESIVVLNRPNSSLALRVKCRFIFNHVGKTL